MKVLEWVMLLILVISIVLTITVYDKSLILATPVLLIISLLNEVGES